MYVFDSCSVSREGAVNLSRDVTLQHVIYVPAHLSVLVFPQDTHPQAHAGPYTPPKGNTSWLVPRILILAVA